MSWATSVTIADRIISEAHPAYFIADTSATDGKSNPSAHVFAYTTAAYTESDE